MAANMLDDLEDIFGVGIAPMEEIPIDDSEETKQYFLSLKERVTKLQNSIGVDDEAILSSRCADQSSSLVLTDDSIRIEEPSLIDVKEFVELDTETEKYSFPILRLGGQKKWIEVLRHHEERILDVAYYLKQLYIYPELTDEIKLMQTGELYKLKESELKHIKDKTNRKLAAKTLVIQELESQVFDQLGSAAFKLKDIRCQVDESTNGIWVNVSQDEEANDVLKHMGTKKIVVNRRFMFDARQTEDLVAVTFATSPEVRARAKLNLNARLQHDIFHEVITQTARTLEVVVSEALLTQEEILCTVFPARGTRSQNTCLSCKTVVNITKASVYHKNCKTVRWLTRYARFKYDTTDECLTQEKVLYLAPGRRRLLVNILKMHAQLRRDVVVKTSTETSIWRRTSDGRLIKSNVRSQREADIVGSYAWRRAHGLSK